MEIINCNTPNIAGQSAN